MVILLRTSFRSLFIRHRPAARSVGVKKADRFIRHAKALPIIAMRASDLLLVPEAAEKVGNALALDVTE